MGILPGHSSTLNRSARTGMAALVFAVAGCAVQQDGLRLRPPERSPGSQVALETTTTAAGVEAVVGRLRAAGLTVTSASPATGRIAVRASDSSLVDCGTFVQTIDRTSATFEGTAPVAAIFDFNQPGDLMLREAATDSRATIVVAPGVASVAETHRVTLRHRSPRGGVVWSQTETFDRDSAARFADGTVCVSSDRLREIIR